MRSERGVVRTLYRQTSHTDKKTRDKQLSRLFFPFSLPGLGALVPRPVGAPPPAAPTGGTYRYCYIQRNATTVQHVPYTPRPSVCPYSDLFP